MNPKESKINNGKELCPYCRQKFQDLDKHTPYCESKKDFKKNETQLSTEERQDEIDGKVLCPYCHKRFKCLAKHTPRCKAKPDYGDLKNNETQLSTDKRQDDDDVKVPCPYCHKRFKCLAKHTPRCKAKPDYGDLKNNETQLSTDKRQDDDDVKVPCPYCHKRFKCLAKHTPSCKAKPDYGDLKNNETQLSTDKRQDDDDGKVPCSYCHKRFKCLAKHTPRCKAKPDYGDLKNNETQLSTDERQDEIDGKVFSDGEDDEDDRRKHVYEEDLKNSEAQLSTDVKPPCQYCGQNYDHVRRHEAKCPFRSIGQYHFDKFKHDIGLKRNDIDITNVNDKLKYIKKQLNDEQKNLSWDILNTGSYYSLVKVSYPDEFDYMFCPTRVQCRIQPDLEHPCHCKVFIKNKAELPVAFTNILESSGEIIPSKYKEFCFEMFDKIVKNGRNFKRITNESISPAYTVQYKYKTGAKPVITEMDWVPCLKVKIEQKSYMEWKTRKLTNEEKEECDIYVVAKEPSDGDKLRNLWRLSYSKIEKKIIRVKCKREDHTLIRIIKKILEEAKNDDPKICSYHIVTHCLHYFEEVKNKPELKQYTIDFINSLIVRLESRDLRHFFIPKFNLLREVSKEECQRFIERLKYYKEMWTKEEPYLKNDSMKNK